MKKLTKMSLEKLAETMNVIPENERDMYWGMYDNDCFWRCVAYLSNLGITEAAAETVADEWCVFQGTVISNNDSAISGPEMQMYLNFTSMMVGSDANNRMVGVAQTNDLEYYRNNGEIPAYQNHCLILENVNSNGDYEMFDPQHNVRFTVTDDSEKDKLWGLNCPKPYTN